LGYGENHDDTRCFLQFLLANGGKAIDSKKNIIMSDRGACAGPVDDVFTRAVHHYCPKHLERNIQHYGKEIVKAFWQARQAKTATAYSAAIDNHSHKTSHACVKHAIKHKKGKLFVSGIIPPHEQSRAVVYDDDLNMGFVFSDGDVSDSDSDSVSEVVDNSGSASDDDSDASSDCKSSGDASDVSSSDSED